MSAPIKETMMSYKRPLKSLILPLKVQHGLQDLLQLNPEEFDVLSTLLQSEPPAPSPRTVAESIEAQFLSACPEGQQDVYEFVRSGIYLCRERAHSALNVEEFAQVVAQSQFLPEEAESTPEQERLVVERLSILLGLDSINITQQAIDEATTDEHILYKAEMLTGIRTLFKNRAEDQEQLPIATLILHTLKLTYGQGDERREFSVSLEANDIHHLSKVLAVAQQKERGLKTMLEPTNVMHLDWQIED